VGNGARVPSGNARPKSAYGQYGVTRSKSHHQGTRPATAMKHHEQDADDDEVHERKGLQPFSIPTIPKDSLRVQKNAQSAPKRRPNSLSVPPKRSLHLSTSRAVSSPSNFRSITPVMEEPTDDSCDDICNTLGSLTLGVSKAVHRDSRVGRGSIPGKEQNPFLKPVKPLSLLPRATPARQQATPTPARPPSTTPRTQAPFINRFTNDRCPDFYDDRVEAIERDFRAFREQMLSDMQQTTDYKDTIQKLQSKGALSRSFWRSDHATACAWLTCLCSDRTRVDPHAIGNCQQRAGVGSEGHAELLLHCEDGARDDTTKSIVRS